MKELIYFDSFSCDSNLFLLIINFIFTVLTIIFYVYLYESKIIKEHIFVLFVLLSIFMCLLLSIGFIYILGISIILNIAIINSYIDKGISIYTCVIFVSLLCFIVTIITYYYTKHTYNILCEIYKTGFTFYLK